MAHCPATARSVGRRARRGFSELRSRLMGSVGSRYAPWFAGAPLEAPMSQLPTAELRAPEDLTVESIEGVLADLWRDVDEAHGDSATRVRMLNLLVCLPSLP